MDYASLPLFSLMKGKLGYLSERQAVLAQNIANADTPRYQAKDVAAPDFKKLMHMTSGGGSVLPMQVTSPMHIAHGAVAAASFKIIKNPKTDEQNPDGNNVSTEEELSKVSANQGEYQQVLNLYAKAISMFKTAIGSASGG